MSDKRNLKWWPRPSWIYYFLSILVTRSTSGSSRQHYCKISLIYVNRRLNYCYWAKSKKNVKSFPSLTAQRWADLRFLRPSARHEFLVFTLRDHGYGASVSRDVPLYVAAMKPVPNYTPWWQRHMCVNNLPKVVTRQCPGAESNLRLWVTSGLQVRHVTVRLPSHTFCGYCAIVQKSNKQFMSNRWNS